MASLLEFFPLLAFIGTYWAAGLAPAIAVLMGAMVLMNVATWMLGRTVTRTQLVSTLLVVALGGLTLFLDNPVFFKWKPTVLNWGLALAFLVSQYIGERTLAERFLNSVSGAAVRLDQAGWRRLNTLWIGYFLVAGGSNIVVAYRFPEATWVNFKVFGLLGLTAVFLALMFWWLARRGALADEPEPPPA